LSQPAKSNPYEDILKETMLLDEVKDILDELNILKTLSQHQEYVHNLWRDEKNSSEWILPITPPERTREIENMIEDARSVQSDIKTLLDLKQKEATIIEAQATRRQSDSIMVFTIVTVVFVSANNFDSLLREVLIILVCDFSSLRLS
jgi:Mg2+ and Co2+ transporter CorA